METLDHSDYDEELASLNEELKSLDAKSWRNFMAFHVVLGLIAISGYFLQIHAVS